MNSALVAIVILVVIILRATLRVLQEWDRAVVLRLGRFQSVRGPGIIFLFPFIDRPIIVDTRVLTMDVPKQEIMTRDNVPATVDAIVLFKVVNPGDAITRIENYVRTTSLIAQTTLRSTLGQSDLDEMLSQREMINQKLQQTIDEQTEPFGVKVVAVEVRDVVIPESMKRAMARQAESERERRAKVINAQGEMQAAENLVTAAKQMASEPASIQLRFLQTISEIATERSSMTIIPLPIDLFTPFIKQMQMAGSPAPVTAASASEQVAPPAGEAASEA